MTVAQYKQQTRDCIINTSISSLLKVGLATNLSYKRCNKFVPALVTPLLVKNDKDLNVLHAEYQKLQAASLWEGPGCLTQPQCNPFKATKEFSTRAIYAQNLQDAFALTFEGEALLEFRFAVEHPTVSLLIEGMPGCGKTVFACTLSIYYRLISDFISCVTVAPTNSACTHHAPASTIQSFFCFGTYDKSNDDEKKKKQALKLLPTLPNTARKKLTAMTAFLNPFVKQLYIDEGSLVSDTLFYLSHLRAVQIFGNSHLSFGGLRVIVYGDFGQLPPVSGISLMMSILAKKNMNPIIYL